MHQFLVLHSPSIRPVTRESAWGRSTP